jgi:hypothetical protein
VFDLFVGVHGVGFARAGERGVFVGGHGASDEVSRRAVPVILVGVAGDLMQLLQTDQAGGALTGGQLLEADVGAVPLRVGAGFAPGQEPDDAVLARRFGHGRGGWGWT